MNDVLVIGAGYTGAMVAAHLAAQGAHVAIVDAQAVGDGATRRAIGLATPSLSLQHLAETMRGLNALTYMADQHGVIPVICNVLHVAGHMLGNDQLRQQFLQLQKADAARFAWETSIEVVPKGFGAAISVAHSLQINLEFLTVKLLQHPNISVYPNVEITQLRHENGIMHALAEGYTLRAESVVLATNAYSGSLSSYLAESVRFARGTIWTSRPLEEESYDAGLYAWPVIVDGGRLLVARGNDSRLRIAAWNMDDRSPGNDRDPGQAIRRFLDQQASDLLSETERWQSGVTTYTADGAPLVDRLDMDGRVFYATAAGLYGLAWGPIIAEKVTDLINPV